MDKIDSGKFMKALRNYLPDNSLEKKICEYIVAGLPGTLEKTMYQIIEGMGLGYAEVMKQLRGWKRL